MFTDKDLQRVKDELAANRRMEWPMPDCEALIARLEAAEALAQAAIECGVGKPLWEAWKKTKGK